MQKIINTQDKMSLYDSSDLTLCLKHWQRNSCLASLIIGDTACSVSVMAFRDHMEMPTCFIEQLNFMILYFECKNVKTTHLGISWHFQLVEGISASELFIES